MHTIQNLLNSPYEVMLADGSKAMLPARGVLENVEVHPMHLPLYRSIGYFKLTEVDVSKADPLDHDGDGKKGGSKPAAEADNALQKLRNEYTELTGKKPHHLWRADRLQSEIDKALAA